MKKPLFNPSVNSFNVEVFDDKNQRINLSIPGKTIEYFEDWQFPLVRRHLADFILNERGYVKTNWEDDIKEIYKEIDVEL